VLQQNLNCIETQFSQDVVANTKTIFMNYHVRISLKSQKSSDETKTDFSEEQLRVRILEPYEQGEPIIVNGKTIQPDDVERIRISRSQEPSPQIIQRIKADDRNSSFISFGGPSYDWWIIRFGLCHRFRSLCASHFGPNRANNLGSFCAGRFWPGTGTVRSMPVVTVRSVPLWGIK